MTQLTYRDSVSNMLAQKVGFPIDESVLSPVARRRISELVEMRQGVDARQALIPQERMNVTTLQSRRKKLGNYVTLTLIIGVATVIILVGIAFFALAIYYYRQRQKIDRQIVEENNRTATLQTEINSLNYSFNQRVDQVCEEIQAELSAAYIMKPGGSVPQVQTFQTNSVQTINTPPSIEVAGGAEVIKASRTDSMIECAFCGKPFSNTSMKCPYCAASRAV